MFEIRHCGLYFQEDRIIGVKDQRRKSPYADALSQLDALQPDDALAQVIVDGFRYRFQEDATAGRRAQTALVTSGVGLNLPPDVSYIEAAASTMALGQAFELVRDSLPVDVQRGWLRVFDELVQQLRTAEDLRFLDFIWRTALKIVTAVVLEREEQFLLGREDFQQIIGNEIHPEGYLPRLVEKSKGGSLERQVLAVQALVLAAEAAGHVGSPLWDYEVRGVSVKTAAIYAIAYYEFPENWRWDPPLSLEASTMFFDQHAGFFEMLNRQLRPEVLRMTMQKARPIFDVYGGGLTTLSHGFVEKRGFLGF